MVQHSTRVSIQCRACIHIGIIGKHVDRDVAILRRKHTVCHGGGGIVHRGHRKRNGGGRLRTQTVGDGISEAFNTVPVGGGGKFNFCRAAVTHKLYRAVLHTTKARRDNGKRFTGGGQQRVLVEHRVGIHIACQRQHVKQYRRIFCRGRARIPCMGGVVCRKHGKRHCFAGSTAIAVAYLYYKAVRPIVIGRRGISVAAITGIQRQVTVRRQRGGRIVQCVAVDIAAHKAARRGYVFGNARCRCHQRGGIVYRVYRHRNMCRRLVRTIGNGVRKAGGAVKV